MKKLSSALSYSLKHFGSKSDVFRLAHRTAEVRRMWACVVEEAFLMHTNSVSIVREDGYKKLVVYVDESIFAAELNARRELIKLKLHQQFGEEIEVFDIRISYGPHKRHHPYLDTPAPPYSHPVPPVPLTPEQMRAVEEQTDAIEDPRLRRTLRRAMVSNMEWNKGIEKKNSRDR